MKSIKEIQDLVEETIPALKFGKHPENLYEPIAYILTLGGKRLRPSLVLQAYQLSGKDPAKIVREALSVEVFHNFTLMHDDIMDEAPIRRGQPTVHEKWNQTVAILSGDTMLVKAYDLLLDIDGRHIHQVLKRFNQTATEVCEGQQVDMNFEDRDHVSDEEYLNMIRLKTAVLLGYSMELGGILADFGADDCKKLFDIGENMGLGFQLMDDYLDVYADAAKFGKQVGGDIISNKKTYLLIKALENSNSAQNKELRIWIDKKEFDAADKVRAVKNLYDEIGIPGVTQQKMDFYFDRAVSLLREFAGDEAAKLQLEKFALKLMKRDR